MTPQRLNALKGNKNNVLGGDGGHFRDRATDGQVAVKRIRTGDAEEGISTRR